jgi:hypothetical protein
VDRVGGRRGEKEKGWETDAVRRESKQAAAAVRNERNE